MGKFAGTKQSDFVVDCAPSTGEHPTATVRLLRQFANPKKSLVFQ